MFSIQSITVLAPSLMYIGTNVFFNSLTTALWSLPLVLLFLFLMFNMRIYFFGKSKNKFLIEEVLPEKRIEKWVLIFLIEYSAYILTLSIAFLFYASGGGMLLFTFINIFSIVGVIISSLIFKKIFSIRRAELKARDMLIKMRYEGVPTWFTKHPWITTLILIIFNSVLFYLLTLIPYPQPPYPIVDQLGYEIYKWSYLFMYNFPYILLWIILTPIFLGIPYGKLPIRQYLKKITVGWEKHKTLKFMICILITCIVVYLNYLVMVDFFSYGIPIPDEYLAFYIFNFVLIFCIYFWQGFLFLGIIFILISKKMKSWIAIVVCSLIYSIFHPRFFFNLFMVPYMLTNISYLLIEWLISFIPGLISALIYFKVKNLFIISSIALSFEFGIRFLLQALMIIPLVY